MEPLIELQERLALYRTAERSILEGNQSYTIGSQTFTKANLGQIQSAISRLRQEIAMHPDNTNRGRMSHSQTVFGGRRG